MWWLFVGAPLLFWCSISPCCPTLGGGVWCTSSSLPGVAKPPVWEGTRSYGPGHYKLLWYSELTEEVSNQCFRHCWSLSVGNGMEFWPHGKIVRSDQEVSVFLVALWERPCYIDRYPFEWDPDVVLMSLAPIPGSGAPTGCAVVARLAPLLNIISCLELVVPLPCLIQWPPDGLPCSLVST
jgi:hypothetical protein